MLMLTWATILFIVPFKYILSFLLFDMFTRELEFRREMVERLTKLLRERWHAVPAAPVAVLPFENEESKSEVSLKELENKAKPPGNQSKRKSG